MCKVTQLLCKRCGVDSMVVVELCEEAKTKKIAEDPLHSARNEFIRAVGGPPCAPCYMVALKTIAVKTIAEEDKKSAEKHAVEKAEEKGEVEVETEKDAWKSKER